MPGQVTVACRHPNGLLLRLFEPSTQRVPVMGGGFAEEKMFRATGASVQVKGPARRIDDARPPVPGAHGYALTHGVDADFWAKWFDQNKESPIVKSGIVFAHEKPVNMEAEAREKRDVKTGLEPIDPNNLPRGIETKKD